MLSALSRAGRTGIGFLRRFSALHLFWILTCVLTVAAGPVYALTNSATGTVSGSALDVTNASISLTLNNPPTLTKAFAPDTIDQGDTSTLTLTITNPNGFDITGVAVTDTYPAEIVNADPHNGSTDCTGGTVTATVGGNSVGLSGATVEAGTSCTVTIDVTSSTVGGPYTNTTGVVTSTESADSATASDDLTVVAPNITLSKAADKALAAPGETVTYTLTYGNTGAGDATELFITEPYLVPGPKYTPMMRMVGGEVFCEYLTIEAI